MICPKDNFVLNQHSANINNTFFGTFNNEEELLHNIKDGLRSQDFSTSFDESSKQNNYEESVNSIVDTILEKLPSKVYEIIDNKTELEIKEIIKKEITAFLLTDSQTKVEPVVQAIIPDAELYSEQERKAKEYKDLVDEFFKDLPAASEHRSEIISRNLLINSIINTSKDRSMVIADSTDLNENLMSFKKDEYLKLKKYLQKYYGYTGYSSGLYSGYTLNSKSLNAILKDTYQIIQEKINNPGLISFHDELKTSWLNSIMGNSEEIGLYDVVNAYLNLMYFDKILEDALGSYIRIDDSLLEPIVIKIDSFGEEKEYYKYSFNSGNAETVKGWETAENRDAIKEMGKYSKIIIESIPFYKYDTTTGKIEKLNLHLNPVRFSNAITRLFDSIQKLNSNVSDNNIKSLYNLVYTKHLSMEEKFPKILNILFSNTDNQTLYKNLKKAGLTEFDINVLYSIRECVYVKRNRTKESYYSYNELEQEYFAENGMTSGRYPIVKSLLGLIDSIVSMNYLQSTYNHNDSEQQINIKLKFPTDKKVYEMVSNVNGNIVNNLHDPELLNIHLLEQNINMYTITTNGTSFTIMPTIKSKIGVLSKSNKSTEGAMIENFDKLADWNSIYNLLATDSGRNELLSDNLNKDQRTFMNMLKFIDDMLYTSFSKNKDGLILFDIYNQLDNRGLEHLLMAASRARIIMNIYDKFEKTKSTHKLTSLLLEEYLIKENDKKNATDQIYPYVKFGKDSYGHFLMDSSIRRQLFKSVSTGDYLSVIVDSELWLHNLSHAHAIMSGQVSKAVIKNLENKSVPNFSPAFEGAFLKKRIYEANSTNDEELTNASSFLIFANDINSIKEVVIDTDVQVKNGSKVQVKNMSKGELILHSLEKYFLPSQTSKNEIIIQPTSYSDKSKLINYIISKSINGIPDLTKASTFELENKMMETLGNFYKLIFSNVLNDYIKLFDIDFEYISASNFDENKENIRNLISEINLRLKNISLKKLIELGNAKNIEIHADMHYRKIGGKLHMNELLYHYTMNVYQDINSLRNRLIQEKIEFAESIIKNRVHITLNFNENGDLEHDNSITSAFIKKFPIDKNNSVQAATRNLWIHGKKLVIGKINRVNANGKTLVINVVYGTKINLQPNDTFELNPLLENYFMVHSLMGNNIRFSLSGSEINHKIKSLGKQNLQKTAFAKFSNVLVNYGITDLSTTTLVELDHAIHLADIKGDTNAITLRKLYNNYLHELESQGQIAQIKRNVIIPATLNYYLQDTLDGITSVQNVAVVEDIGAHVFNFDGLATIIDAHDGAALVDPFTSKLENKSLQDREVGTVKKPIWHHYNHKYGTAYLAKYAVDTITNLWMRLSEGSNVSLRKLFRKMTNKQWEQKWDLLHSAEHKNSPNTIFSVDILESKKLFYKKGTKHYQIINFDKDENGWYTVETEVSNLGNVLNTGVIKVYHYFDTFGNHYASKTGVDEMGNPYITDENGNITKLHTINSLYELHTSMGGIWSESETSNGLQYSEASVDAVVNFMNNVTILKEGADPDVKIQTNYYQPLKHGYISYVANNSAIKNGAANVNSSDVYYNDEELSYMKVSTEGHGIQMDADHTSDEAQMTEFSQVISSLDAGGRLHGYVKQIYEVLGQIALELSQIEVQALKTYRDTGNISDIYDIVGRTIINNFANKSGQAGLAEAIIKKIKNKFNLNSNHELDTFKIPFSDPNIYSNILSTFVSIINGKSIKRKYPGQGTVMVPGYNISQIWEFDDKTYQYEDLIKQAQLNLDNISDFENITDISEYNKSIIQAYLRLKQDQIPTQTSLNSFLPTDNVLVNVTGERFMSENINKNEVDYEIVEKPWASDPKKSNTTIRFYIKGQPRDFGYFELVKDHEVGYYSVHFKTGNPDTNEIFGSTPEQRQLLYKNLYAAIPNGAKVSTWGKISFGGRIALSKLMENCEVVETRKVNDREGNFIDIPVYQKPGNLQLEHETNVSLYNINDYYDFKGNPSDYLLKNRGYVNVTTYRYRKNIMKARDLAPAKISFKYLNENNEEIETNIFDTPPLVEAYRKKLKESDAETQKSVQEILDGLAEDKYYHVNGNLIDENGKTYFKVTSIKNVPAELIMSNIYKSRFGIKEGLSLRDVLDDSASFLKTPEVINSKFWDLVFTKGDGKHLYITFNPINSTVDNKRKDWKMINRKAFRQLEGHLSYNFETETYDENGVEVVNKVYATDKNNIRLFEIGRDIIRNDVQYDKEKGKFVDLQGNVKKHQKRFRRISESKVSEYVEFVYKNEIIEDGKKHILYNINKQALGKVFVIKDATNPDKEINEHISKLLGDIYKSQSHSGIQVQTTLTRKSAILLKSTLNGLGNELNYDTNLKDLLTATQRLLVDATKDRDLEGNKHKDYILPARYNIIKRKYYTNLKSKIRASFEKAQYFTASRIPAQTLQSFMQMKCVGFTGTATNLCFVSHWQTWLQGSDYDIDKAYIMGHNFDDNGVYIGWSNLFKYSSLEAIKASEYLPIPQGRHYAFSNNGYDITKYEVEFANLDDVGKVKMLTKVLNNLNKLPANENGKVLIKSNLKNDSLLYQAIISHETTKLPQDLRLESFKNFISSHIENTIQNVRNMIGAYTPIDMEVLRGAIDYSDKQTSKKMTLTNPLSIYEIQYASMVGKKVIGIAATGEKASFMWHYWLNDVIREDVEIYKEYGKFSHSLSRLYGRSLKNPETKNVNCLPDVNLEGVNLEGVERLVGRLPVDGMISQTLSAATDNVKELILDKINAGSKLAKCHLYLITLGYDINDIVNFMANDVINFIDLLTESNIYENLNISMDDAISIAKGVIPKNIWKKFFTNKAQYNTFLNFKDKEGNEINKNYLTSYLNTEGEYLVNPYPKTNKANYLAVQEFIDFINELKAHRPTRNTEQGKQDLLLDIADFEKILAGANEFSNFGRLLGLNQGLPTSKVDLRKLLDAITNIITDREKYLEITDDNGYVNKEKLNAYSKVKGEFDEIAGKFNVIKFLNDPEYRQLAIRYQNAIKENIPIFKIIEDIPQFKSILDLLNIVQTFDRISSVKSRVFDEIMDIWKLKKYYVDDFMLKGLLSYIDDLLVVDFMEKYNYKYPIQKGTTTFDGKWRVLTTEENIDMSTPQGMVSFKYVFENIVIPRLKKGEFWNGNIILQIPELKNNQFIQNLIRTSDKEMPLYKADLDMLEKDSSANSIAKFLEYVIGLKQLQEYKINGVSLSDWFIIYNLIVNKNHYGSDRLTTLLQEFITENKSNFLLDYLNHIGKIDYTLDYNLKYSEEDALVATARTVSSTYGRKEPMLIVNEEDGPTLYRKVGFEYQKVETLVPEVTGETREETVLRIARRMLYGSLRINYSSYIDSIILNLEKFDKDTIDVFIDLMRQGLLTVTNICE